MLNAETLLAGVLSTARRDAVLITDEWPGCGGLGRHFEIGPETVNHNETEYARFLHQSGLAMFCQRNLLF